jgi:hypothetical protein
MNEQEGRRAERLHIGLLIAHKGQKSRGTTYWSLDSSTKMKMKEMRREI